MLFVCEKCEHVENTAFPLHYLATVAARVQVNEGATREPIVRRSRRQLKCTVCEGRKWHGHFPRRKYDSDRDGPIGYMRQLRTNR